MPFSFEERKHMKEDKDTKFDFSWFYFLGTVLVILKALNLTAIPWHWAMNEEMVDFFALQFPKITKAMKKAGAL